MFRHLPGGSVPASRSVWLRPKTGRASRAASSPLLYQNPAGQAKENGCRMGGEMLGCGCLYFGPAVTKLERGGGGLFTPRRFVVSKLKRIAPPAATLVETLTATFFIGI